MKSAMLLKHLAENAPINVNKEQIFSQVSKLRSMANEPSGRIREELAKFEKQLAQALSFENMMIFKESRDIDSLNSQIEDLKTKLRLSNSDELKKRLDKILFLLGDISARMDVYSAQAQVHNKAIEDIDERMGSIEPAPDIKMQLQSLEEKYKLLKARPDIDKIRLELVQTKIKELKRKVIESNLSQPEEEKPVETAMPMENPRHTVLISPQPPQPMPAEEQIEEEPELDKITAELEALAPPPPPKRGIVRRLFG